MGASSPCDQRKSPSSCDGETGWGSNYGTGLDVVASGVKIYTTDLQGSNGYNTSGDYFANFNGTSSATPHVAATVALLLSANATLTGLQARQLLESTTDKVGGYSYTTVAGKANGTWNNEMGYGRINAYRALLGATGIAMTGPESFCSTATYTISNLPANTDVTWTVHAGRLRINSGQHTPTVNITGLTRGPNLAGRLVKKQEYSNMQYQEEVNVADMHPGVYIIEIFNGVSTSRKKVIIQK